MPYKEPERKRQWEREHREQRNAARRKQPLPPGSGQDSGSKHTAQLAAGLRSRKPTVSGQKQKGSWKPILGWTVAIGVVLLGALAGLHVSDS